MVAAPSATHHAHPGLLPPVWPGRGGSLRGGATRGPPARLAEGPIPLLLSVLLACAEAESPHSEAPDAHLSVEPQATSPSAARTASEPSGLSEQARGALPARVVAVGDLHGDLDQALTVLRMAGVVDAEGGWAGGSTVLVHTGDTLDRGPQSREILDLWRRLEREAPADGGRVVVLLGNHESMNLLGDWRYVDADDVAGFGGVAARRTALSADGPYGAWLLEHDLVARVGDTVFVHGGITPTWAEAGIDRINTEAREALRAGRAAPVLGESGPQWYRGYVLDPESEACPELGRSLERLGAARMVVGHTTRRDGRIEARCGGRLLVIDVGISEHYGGHVAALEIVRGDARALYPDGPVDLPDPT